MIKTAILMPEAKDGEVTIVEVESVGFNKTKVERINIKMSVQVYINQTYLVSQNQERANFALMTWSR